MPRPLLIATRNAHKTREIAQILGERFAVTDLKAHPEIPETVESGETFRENAILKAVEASHIFSGLVLSDDSGLEVDALGGAPGVRSARYAGEPTDDARNRVRLLKELTRVDVRGKARSARFHCVMALAEKGEVIGTFDGVVEGVIINREKGGGGFGYDSLFVPEGHCETFAELPEETKNGISHRGRALEKVCAFLAM
jgi:XTP/dITP diphosphohydrolase